MEEEGIEEGGSSSSVLNVDPGSSPLLFEEQEASEERSPAAEGEQLCSLIYT